MNILKTDKNQSFESGTLYPNIRDTLYRGPQTIYLAEGEGPNDPDIVFVDSDDLGYRHSKDDLKQARHAAEAQVANPNCAAYFEAYLRHLFNQPALVLVLISTRINVHDGFAIHLYGYHLPRF